MNADKITINATHPNTIVQLLEGKAPEQLSQMPPIKLNITGTISAPARLLEQRGPLLNIEKCHVIVSREAGSIKLIINEDDEYNEGQITGIMKPALITQRLGINTGKKWSTTELGQMFKMTRAFFPDRDENMKLVAILKNFQATINSKIEKMKNENGSYLDAVSAEVSSNLPNQFTLEIPAWTGSTPAPVTVEIYSTIDGKNVVLELWSPALEEIMQVTLDEEIDRQLGEIIEYAPGIVIIEK